MDNFKLEGLIVAPATALHENGEINLAVIGQYSDFLLSQGIKHVYLNGCTGEGPSLTVNERKIIAEKWIKDGKDKLNTIIVQIGGTNIKDSQDLAVHAKSTGASAIASLPPLFYKCNISTLVEYCRELTSVVPDMPFMYYHIPGYTGVNIKIEEFLKATKERVPSLVGVKFTHADLFGVSQSMLVENGKFQISLGSDENLLSGLAVGIQSAIGSTYNYCGKLNNAIIESFRKGDIENARKFQVKAQTYVKILIQYGGDAAVTKAILSLCGLHVGPPRLPLMALSDKKKAELKVDLETAGFFDGVTLKK